MTDMTAPPPQEVRQIKVKLGTGKEWPYPVEVIKTLLESMSAENPSLVGRHLQGALMGEIPGGRGSRRHSNGDS